MKKYLKLSQLDPVTLNTHKGIYDILRFLKESFSFYHLKLSILFLDLFSCLLNFAFIEVLLLFMLITVLRYSISIIQGQVHCADQEFQISFLKSGENFSISFHPNCKRGIQFGSYLIGAPDPADQLLKDIHFFIRPTSTTKVKQIFNPVKNCSCCDLLQAAWIYLQKLCRGM